MSKPSSGDYVIYNRVLSPSGEKLALAFHGQDKAVTVEPYTKSYSQIWTIADYDYKTQSISPKSSSGLQAGWGNPGAVVLPAGNYVWTIRSSDSGYTIQDGGVTVFWGVTSPNSGSSTLLGPDQALLTQRWVFERV